ncbi:YegJ family protein [Acinetobacter venetianus]
MNIRNTIFSNESPEMISAFNKAQETFKYFWRELSWEYRRIIPAFDLAYVKCAFIQEHSNSSDSPLIEYMWISQIDFDGTTISGQLMNQPNYIDNVQAGEIIEQPFEMIVDWMFLTQDQVYGGFTIQEYRKQLNDSERKEYDASWGINFGDPNNILFVYDQEEHPENLIEHPMCEKMLDSFLNFIQTNPTVIHERDDRGNQLLHREALAGNFLIIQALLQYNLDKSALNNQSMTASDLAHKMGWENIAKLLA